MNNSENEKNIATHYVINKEILNRNKIVITNSFFWRCEVSIPVSLACYIPTILHQKTIPAHYVVNKETFKRTNILSNRFLC